MKKNFRLGTSTLFLVMALAIIGYNSQAVAFNFGDMMSPGKWMGNKKNRNDDVPPPGQYGPGGVPYGYGGNPGYGYGAPPAGQNYGYGAPPAGGQAPAYGYGANPYGYSGQPAVNPAYPQSAPQPYPQTAPQPVPGVQGESVDKQRIRELEERVRALESQLQRR